MKITKYEHSCLLVEMSEPINRTALFDPGLMSEGTFPTEKIEFLDDIIITHIHADHVSLKIIREMVDKFPSVRITAPSEVVDMLEKEDIIATSEPSEGIVFFDSPHESVSPLFDQPEQIGVHYLNLLSHPGDSHSFDQSKSILALPVTAPWGTLIKAVNLALELKPDYILPIHDWHWRDEARNQTYADLEKMFSQHQIVFIPLKNGEPVVIDTPA